MTSDGAKFWRMTHYAENWGVIRPSFSHNGYLLYWNEEFSMEKYPAGSNARAGSYWGLENAFFRKGEELGAWRIKYADIAFSSGGPRLSNIRTISPPPDFTLLEGAGFTPDDKGFIYSYVDLSLTKGGRALRGDIYRTDLQGNTLKRLTFTPEQHDENPTYSPDGEKIAWCHPVGTGRAGGMPGAGEELFLMNKDGSQELRLTYFSDSDYPEYDRDSRQITELSWNPNGKQIVLGHASRKKRGGLEIGSSLWILTFKVGYF